MRVTVIGGAMYSVGDGEAGLTEPVAINALIVGAVYSGGDG